MPQDFLSLLSRSPADRSVCEILGERAPEWLLQAQTYVTAQKDILDIRDMWGDWMASKRKITTEKEYQAFHGGTDWKRWKNRKKWEKNIGWESIRNNGTVR